MIKRNKMLPLPLGRFNLPFTSIPRCVEVNSVAPCEKAFHVFFVYFYDCHIPIRQIIHCKKKSVDFTVKYLASGYQFFYRYFHVAL